MISPEASARQKIDEMLTASGWEVQNRAAMNLYATRGGAMREFPLATGFANYILFVDRKAVGIVEAKAQKTTLSGVAEQAGQYSVGLPANIPHFTLPLPYLYESTGIETLFRDNRDPNPRSRRIYIFQCPETLDDWVEKNRTFRDRLNLYPPLITNGLWKAQINAITNLEASLAADKPRALIQMATGSGKTFTAVSFIYRMLKFGKARRVLFLVDRANLGRQTLKEFHAYSTPDDGRKFYELYNVQLLQSNSIDPVNRVVVTTIQRLYSMLRGDEVFEEANEEGSLFEMGSSLDQERPKEGAYNPKIPIETFDVIITDECHRSIYNLWRQVLEYFDAYLIGSTATHSRQTFGFFNQNLVMEYPRPRAVADGVNVDGEVYRIRTRITGGGSEVESGFWVGQRDKLTRHERWELLEEGELPDGWKWATVEQIGTKNEQIVLTGPFGSNLGGEDFIDKGIPVLTIGCLTEYGIHLSKAKYISEEKANELSRYKLRIGDLLFSRMATVGRAGLVTKNFENAIINYHLMRLRLADEIIDPDFFLSYVRDSSVIDKYVRDVYHGATRDGINSQQLLSMPIVLPPIVEQRRIVYEIERRFSMVQDVETEVVAGLTRAERLRQSVLKSAFEGRLS